MNNDFSVIRLILDASIPVQIVLALLLIASIASWAVIFEKRRLLKQAMKDAYMAYMFHLDGYWQAATGRREFWSGVRPIL